MARVFVAFHPRRKTERPLLYEDLIAMNQAGQNASVSKIIEMIDDLRAHGRNSRYVNSSCHLQNTGQLSEVVGKDEPPHLEHKALEGRGMNPLGE